MGRGHWKKHDDKLLVGRVGREFLRDTKDMEIRFYSFSQNRFYTENEKESQPIFIRMNIHKVFYSKKENRIIPDQALPVTNHWSIPVELNCHGNITKFDLHGAYDDDFSVEADIGTREHNNVHTFFDNGMPNGTGAKLRGAREGYVKLKWGIKSTSYTISNLNVSNNDVKEKESIQKHLEAHREAIAVSLASDYEDHLERQAILNEHKENLLKLDIHGNLFKLFIYFIGKDISATPFATLVNTRVIKQENENFRKKLNTVLSPSLVVSDDKSTLLQAKSIAELKELNEADHKEHPKFLYRRGMELIKLYKHNRMLFKLGMPDFARFQDFFAYQSACFWYQQEFMIKCSYEHFRALYRLHFVEAKIWSKEHEKYFSTSVEEYKTYHRQITQWGFHFSMDPEVTGEKEISFPVDLTSLAQRISLSMCLKREWSDSINILMRYAEQLEGKKLFNSKAINFTVWADSLTTYLRLILTKEWDAHARQAHNTSLERFNMLERLLKIGDELKTVIVTLSKSENLFTLLFTEYRRELQQLPDRIETVLHNVAIEKRDETLRKIFNDPHDLLGNASYFFGKIDVYYHLIHSYGAMLLGYSEISRDELSKLPSQENLKQLFESPKSVNIVECVAKMMESLRSIQDQIASHFHHMTLCRNFYSTYWQHHPDAEVFCLTADDLGVNPFSRVNMVMLEKFLAENPQITQFQLDNVPLTPESLNRLIVCLEKFPNINSIRLHAAGLDKATLSVFIHHKLFCHNLRSLDLSGNDLRVCMIALANLLNICVNLVEIDFSSANINLMSLGTLVDSLNDTFNKQIDDIKLPANSEEWQMLLAKMKNIVLIPKKSISKQKPKDSLICDDLSYPLLDRLIVKAYPIRAELLSRNRNESKPEVFLANHSSLLNFTAFNSKRDTLKYNSSAEIEDEIRQLPEFKHATDSSDSDDEYDLEISMDGSVRNRSNRI